MNNTIQPHSRRVRLVNLNFHRALAAILLCSGAAMGVTALTTESSTEANQLVVGIPGSGVPITVGPYSFRSPAALNPLDSVLAAAVPAAFPQSAAVDTAGAGGSNATSTQTGADTGPRVWSQVQQTLPRHRYNTQMAYDDARGQMVLFSGCCYTDGHLDDTWIREGGEWKQLEGGTLHLPAAPPGRETGQTMVYDAAKKTIVLFGGLVDVGPKTIGPANDTWTWDGSAWTEQHPATSPRARYFHGMAYDAARQKVVVFGGLGGGQVLGDTWTWDGTNWTQETPTTSPSARRGLLMTYDAERSQVVLFGGSGSNDTWTWDGSNWTQQRPLVSPPAKSQAMMAYDKSRKTVVLFGGLAAADTTTWTWDGANWTQHVPATSPPKTIGGGLDYDSQSNTVVLFGGYSDGRVLDSTWSWDGNTWTEAPRNWPQPRSGTGVAYDSLRGQTVVFGGHNFGLYGDTWTWDGTNWTLQTPAVSPPARYGDNFMVFDSARGNILLYGGYESPGRGALDDTWTWDGVNWTLVASAVPGVTAPKVRAFPSMVYDAARSQVVLFGGLDQSNNVALNETWTWDGVKWTKQNPPTSPPGRFLGNMAYDAARGQVVLFSGFTRPRIDPAGSAYVGADTWTWDGTTWTEQHPTLSPVQRDQFSMGYDARTKKVIFFGGNNQENDPSPNRGNYSDTWSWDGSNWSVEDIGSPYKNVLDPHPIERSTPGRPSARGNARISDAAPPLLFGGGESNGATNELWTYIGPPVPLSAVLSRKIHGSAGPFDINLPLTGSPVVECRSGGANREYTMIFKFANELTSVGGATASATQAGGGNQPITATGSINPADRKEYIVNLAGVPNKQVLTVSLTNVNDSVGNSSASVSASMGILLGDTSADGFVNSLDISQTRDQSGRKAKRDPANFRQDLNADGFINSADISIVRTQDGTRLP